MYPFNCFNPIGATMNKFIFIATMVSSTISLAAPISVNDAIKAACQAAYRHQFQFEGGCDVDFSKPAAVNEKYYIFKSSDKSGDCDITVRVEKQNGHTNTKISCS